LKTTLANMAKGSPQHTIIWEIGKLISDMSMSPASSIAPYNATGLVRALEKQIGDILVIRRQNDIHEFFSVLVNHLATESASRYMFKNCSPVSSDDLTIRNLDKSCMDAWERFHKIDYTPLVDSVFGQNIVQIQCGNAKCHSITHNYEPFMAIEVPVPVHAADLPTDDNTIPDAARCISNYMTENSIINSVGSEREWKCDSCNECHVSKRTTKIWRCPRTLIVCLKRFTMNKNARGGLELKKVSSMININRSINLEIGNHVINPSMKTKYALCGVACHSGTTYGGHYYSLVRKGQTWYFIDDNDVQTITRFEEFHYRDAYMFFYNVMAQK